MRSARLTKDLVAAVRGGHPWLFDKAVNVGSAQPGELVQIKFANNEVIAVGFADPQSPIRVRILSTADTLGQLPRIDAAWIESVARAAARCRGVDPALTATNARRLVHGEGDFMPGLVVDAYDDVAVVSMDGGGCGAFWEPHLDAVWAGLNDGGAGLRSAWQRARGGSNRRLFGRPPQVVRISEHGAAFEVDVVHGQKTGFFLDHRDNRQRVGGLSADARVLNLFGYTGGFAIHAARAGARATTTVEMAKATARAAEVNIQLNELDPQHHKVHCVDAFDFLQAGNDQYDVIVCDPPSFAPSARTKGRALSAYRRINELALRRIVSGGWLVTASCSSHVTRDDLVTVVGQASAATGRRVRIVDLTGAATDHPIRAGFPEGDYLGCLYVWVD